MEKMGDFARRSKAIFISGRNFGGVGLMIEKDKS